MATKPQIVPSKNALRALRRLAFSTPAVVVGVIGSACCAAQIHQDASKRVHIAQQILDTKRTIRSVSNGHGASHMARMFDAAEKGENFMLDPVKSHKRRRIRHYSAVAVRQFEPETEHAETHGKSSIHGNAYRSVHAKNEGLVPRKIESESPFSDPRHRSSPGSHQSRPDAGRTGSRTVAYGRIQEPGTAWQSGPTNVGSPQQTNAKGPGKLSPGVNVSTENERIATPAQPSTSVGGITTATQTQHKTPSHAVYGPQNLQMPRNLGQKLSSTGKLSAVDRIMEATQQQHKLSNYNVYNRTFGDPVTTPLGSAYPVDMRPGTYNRLFGDPVTTPLGSAHPVDMGPGTDSEVQLLSTERIHNVTQTTVPKKTDKQPESKGIHGTQTLLQSTNPASPSERQSLGTNNGTKAPNPISDKESVAPTFEVSNVRSIAFDQSFEDTMFREWPVHFKEIRKLANQHSFLEGIEIAEDDVFEEDDLDNMDNLDNLDNHLHELGSESDCPVGTVNVPESTMNELSQNSWLLEPGRASVAGTIDGEFSALLSRILKGDADDANAILNSPEACLTLMGTIEGELEKSSKALPRSGISTNHSRTRLRLGIDRLQEVERVEYSNQTDLRMATPQRLVNVVEFLDLAVSKMGPGRTRHLWRLVLEVYASEGTDEDMAMVSTLHRLYGEEEPMFPEDICSVAARKLVRYMFASDAQSTRAARILFPGSERHGSRNDRIFRSSMLYLKDFCDDVPSLEDRMSELHKVVHAAQVSGLRPAEHIFVPILQSLCSHGNMEQATALFEEMITKHQVKATFFTQSIIAQGYADANNWSGVQEVLQRLHEEGLSRTKPLGYAQLFNSILRRHVEQHPILETYDYTIHAIGYLGLVPTSTISTTIIQALLMQKRFDLVQEWVQAVRELFPQVSTGTDNQSAAWHIGQTWKMMKSSCVDIERACRAMACGSTEDPFSNVFRAVAREAVTADLGRTVIAAQTSLAGREPRRIEVDQCKDLDDYFEQAYSILSSGKIPMNSQKKPNKLVQEVSIQVKAVARLRDLFEGKSSDPTWTTADEGPRTAERRPPLLEPELIKHHHQLPALLRRKILPGQKELSPALLGFYAERSERGVATDHQGLKVVYKLLARQQRVFDAVNIIEIVYKSKYVQGPDGVPFDLDIFSDWLKLAYDLKSSIHVRSILWALFESGRSIKINTQFILLARMATKKSLYNRLSRPSEEEAIELGYLGDRLNYWHWQQMGGRPLPEVPKFPNFKGWEEISRVDEV